MIAAGTLGFDTASLGRLAVNCLYVLLGFAGGYIAMILASAGYEHWVSRHPVPKFVNKLLRLLGGAIVATLVALLVFHEGGSGGPGGGGGGQAPATGKGSAPATQPDTPPAPTVKPTPPKPSADTINITILGGFQPGDAYYRLDDDGGRTVALGEAFAHVKRRKETAAVPPVLALTLDPVNKTQRRNPVVTGLQDKVTNELRLAVTFPAEGS